MDVCLKFIITVSMVGVCLAASRPVFQAGGDMSDLSLVENTPVGTNVYNLSAKDADGDRLYYSIQEDDGYFSVHRFDGQVWLERVIDFDMGLRTLPATIMVSDVVYTEFKVVTITILDTNDEKPQLSQAVYKASIYEDAALGSQVADEDISVTDVDLSNQYIDVACSTEGLDPQYSGSCDTFRVVANANISTVQWTGKLLLNQPLDYDKKQFYELQLVVTDGNPANTVRGKVEVSVLKAMTTVTTEIPITTSTEENITTPVSAEIPSETPQTTAETTMTTVSTEIQITGSTEENITTTPSTEIPQTTTEKTMTTVSTDIPITTSTEENTMTTVSTEIPLSTAMTTASTDSTITDVSTEHTMTSVPIETTEMECYHKSCQADRKTSCWEDTTCLTDSNRTCFWRMSLDGSQEIGCDCPQDVNDLVESIQCCSTALCNDKNFVDAAVKTATSDTATPSSISGAPDDTTTSATDTSSYSTDSGIVNTTSTQPSTMDTSSVYTSDNTNTATTPATFTTATDDVTNTTKSNTSTTPTTTDDSITRNTIYSHSTDTTDTYDNTATTVTSAPDHDTSTTGDLNTYTTDDTFTTNTATSYDTDTTTTWDGATTATKTPITTPKYITVTKDTRDTTTKYNDVDTGTTHVNIFTVSVNGVSSLSQFGCQIVYMILLSSLLLLSK